MTIELFVASGKETQPIREKVIMGLKELSRQHEKSEFEFQVREWEDEGDTVSLSGRSQDEYNKMIDDCDMVAVIIHNTLGKYTIEEFNHAIEKFKETKKSPRVVVYTLPTNDDNEIRFNFVKSLRAGNMDYFHCKIENNDQLIDKIKGELLRIKNDYETEKTSAIEGIDETLSRLKPDDNLTREAVRLFEAGDYAAASEALDVDKIRKRAEELSKKQKEVAEAFFDEALHISRASEILYESASYCQDQNIFKKAEELYTEVLQRYRFLLSDDPSVYNPELAKVLHKLGDLHKDINEYKQAEKEYEEALKIRRELSSENPSAYNYYLAETLNNLGNLHIINNEYQQAKKEFEEALELRQELTAKNPAEYDSTVEQIQSALDELKNKEK